MAKDVAHDQELKRIAERLDRLVERVSELEKGARANSEAGKRWVIVMSERYFTPYDGFISNPTWDTLYTWSDRIEAENICECLFPGDRRISVREAP